MKQMFDNENLDYSIRTKVEAVKDLECAQKIMNDMAWALGCEDLLEGTGLEVVLLPLENCFDNNNLSFEDLIETWIWIDWDKREVPVLRTWLQNRKVWATLMTTFSPQGGFDVFFLEPGQPFSGSISWGTDEMDSSYLSFEDGNSREMACFLMKAIFDDKVSSFVKHVVPDREAIFYYSPPSVKNTTETSTSDKKRYNSGVETQER